MARWSRRQVLKGGGALLAGCAGEPGALPVPTRGPTGDTGGAADTAVLTSPTADRPPIVYVYVDQLRWDALGCTGNPVVPSPTIDALAAESARFSACVTNAPSCRPARVSRITGLQVARHGIWENRMWPDPAMQSHVRELAARGGYRTMVIGKTHLHDGLGHFDDHREKLAAWGYHDAVELPDPQQWQLQSAHSDWLTATTPKGQTDKYRRWQDHIRQYTWDSDPPDAPPWSLATEDHLDWFCGRTAADWIRSYAEDAPPYLQLDFPGPHKPFDPTSEFLARIDPLDPRMPLPILEAPRPPLAPLVERWGATKLEAWDEASARRLRQHYYAKIALVDAALAQVMDALRDAGWLDEAWVIFHSDHGELAADHLFTGKVVAWEGAIRVPLLVRPPGGIAAWEDRGQVDQMDLTATLMSIAGLDPTGFGDRDLKARILGGPDGPLAHATKPVMFENLGSVGLRTEDLKMTWDLALGRPVELYDLRADPQERVNRVGDPGLRTGLDGLVDTLRGLRELPIDHWPA